MEREHWAKALSFVRASERLIKAWENKLDSQNAALSHLEEMGMPFEVMVMPLSLAVGTDTWDAAMTQFRDETLPTFRQTHHLVLTNQVMRNILDAQLPYVRDREKTRGLPPANPISTAKRIEDLLKDEHNPFDELIAYRKLAELEFQLLLAMRKGEKPMNMLRTMLDLRKQLGLSVAL